MGAEYSVSSPFIMDSGTLSEVDVEPNKRTACPTESQDSAQGPGDLLARIITVT